MKDSRVVYLDYLRVAAIFAVVLLHVAAQNWYGLNGRSLEWNILNFYDGLVRWGVPIFVMISGSLFLNRNNDIKHIYKKNIFKLIVVYFVWAIFYAVFVPLDNFLLIINGDFSLKLLLINIICGCYHMWFIPMIIGLYMCIPILKQIVESDFVMSYFMRLSFIFAFVVPWFVMICNDFIGGSFADLVNKFNDVLTGMNLQLVLGFSFYFLLGYILNKVSLKKYQRIIIYILGGVGFLLTILLNAFVAWEINVPCQNYYSNFSINVLSEAVAVHTFFKYKTFDNLKLNTFIFKLSKYSFGAYLVHIFIIELFNVLKLHTLAFNPIVSVPSIFIITIFFSFLVSLLLNHIPKINKWIV